MSRQLVPAAGQWAPIVGYSRALRAGKLVFVAGTTATGADGNVVGPGDAYAQTTQALKNIERALGQVGAKLEHVVRTRMFVTDISRWQDYGRAHGEFFATVRPVSTMVEVSRLIEPAMMIEIEVDAVLD